MIVQPKVRNFICLTAHPVGCKKEVDDQFQYVHTYLNDHEAINKANKSQSFKNVLIIGSSTGYGLSSRIALMEAYQSNTLGIMFEREPTKKKTGTPGFYNDRAVINHGKEKNLYAKTINMDAFSLECKLATIQEIKKYMKKVDVIIYSLAAPRRTDSNNHTWNSVIKPTTRPYEGKTLNLSTKEVEMIKIDPATDDEIEATIKVMGGEDWQDWINLLYESDCIDSNALTIAYSYLGPTITHPIYKDGTIGLAKKHLYETAKTLNDTYSNIHLHAMIAINKAVVTQASAAIPSVTLYLSLLYYEMKKQQLHETCIQQMTRLFLEKIKPSTDRSFIFDTDQTGWIRLDDLEMNPIIQQIIIDRWKTINTEKLKEVGDLEGYFLDFYRMFGFNRTDIDYTKDVDIE